MTKKPDRPEVDSATKAPTQRRILNAARDEFAEFGEAGARVDRIATRAGVNKAMLYYHFGQKEDLYQAVIGDCLGEITSAARDRALSETTLEGVLSALASTFSLLLERIQNLRPILLRELAKGDDATLDQMSEVLRSSSVPQSVFDILQSAVSAGEIRRINVRQAMVSFITMNMGYILMAPVIDRVMGIENRKAFIQERRHAVVDLFMHGVVGREENATKEQ